MDGRRFGELHAVRISCDADATKHVGSGERGHRSSSQNKRNTFKAMDEGSEQQKYLDYNENIFSVCPLAKYLKSNWIDFHEIL